MTLNQEQLTNIIKESINNVIAEQKLKHHIKSLVRESLENFGDYSQFETSEKKYKDDGIDDRLSDMNRESEEDSEIRDSIESFFKQPGVNNAPYAYKLYGVDAQEGEDTNEMKNARKKFADCVNHEKNENGYPYSFSSDELNTLKGMISSNQLDEAINKAFKKVLSEIGDTPRGQYAMAAVAGRAHQRGQMARANGNQEEYYKQIDKAIDVDNAREDASVKSQNNGQMWGGDAARATSRGYTYGINKEKKRQGMTN